MKTRAQRRVHSVAYWLRKAIRSRADAEMYPEYKNALEGLAKLYEQLAERGLKAPASQRRERRLQASLIGHE